MLVGNDRKNRLTGNAGDNLLEGRGGDDRLVGAEGVDTAVFRGAREEYDVDVRDGTVHVTDRIGGRDGTDVLFGVERLRFRDGDVSAPATD